MPTGRHASQRVATPHLWEGILFYLTAMALEDPGPSIATMPCLPASQVPPMGAACPEVTVCAGDCDGDGSVTIDELLTGVTIALDTAVVGACPSFDSSGDGMVTIDELLVAINHSLAGCGPGGLRA